MDDEENNKTANKQEEHVRTAIRTTHNNSEVKHAKMFSLIAATLKCERFIIPLIDVMKLMFVLLLLIVGFPWLYASAFVVERKSVIDYSWGEVGWRCLGGVGYLLNGIGLYIVVVVVMENPEWRSYFGLLLGYCVGLGLLVIFQAFWGRWHEEKIGPGGGSTAVQRFYLGLISCFGIDTENIITVPTSWMWSFSIVSLFLAAIVHTVINVIENQVKWDTMIGQCEEECTGNDNNYSCGPERVMAMYGEQCSCCQLKANSSSYLDIISTIGGSVLLYYGFFKIVVSFFVWGEGGITEEEEAIHLNDNANKDDNMKTEE